MLRCVALCCAALWCGVVVFVFLCVCVQRRGVVVVQCGVSLWWGVVFIVWCCLVQFDLTSGVVWCVVCDIYFLTLLCGVVSCRVVVLSCLVLSCLVLSCLVLSCLRQHIDGHCGRLTRLPSFPSCHLVVTICALSILW